MYSSFEIYNKNSNGQSVVTGITLSGEEAPLLATGSITQSRAALSEFKKSKNFQRIKQNTHLGRSWDTEAAIPATPLNQVAEATAQQFNKQNHLANRFSVAKRFEMMADVIDMVLKGDQRSVLIVGNGGTGKTWEVLTSLAAAGLSPTVYEEDDEELEKGDLRTPFEDDGTYLKVSGAISPLGLYEILYMNQNRVVLFDDCDVFGNKRSVDFLKAALDTTGENEISWHSASVEKRNLPPVFSFNGKVIFISNKTKRQIPQPLLSRSLTIDMELTTREILERARQLDAKLLPMLNAQERKALFDLVEENLYEFNEVTMRLFVLSAPFVKSRSNWRDLILFTQI